MNICKILDLSPATALSSWGTVHFPEENRIIEFVINVESTQWRSTSWSPCKLAPEGGFEEIQAGQTRLMEELADIDSRFQARMICREDINLVSCLRMIMDELHKVNYPNDLMDEAVKVEKILTICTMPSLAKKPSPKPKRRFEVE